MRQQTLIFPLLIMLAGCDPFIDDFKTTSDTGGETDSDTATTTGSSDAGSDSVTESTDTSADTSADTETDDGAASDAEVSDTTSGIPDSGSEMDTTRYDSEWADTGTATDSDTETVTTTETGADIDTDSATAIDSDTVSDSDTAPDTGTETETAIDTATGADTAPDTGTETETATDTATGADTASDTGTETETATATDTGTMTDSVGVDTEPVITCTTAGPCVVYVDVRNTDATLQDGASWTHAFSEIQAGIDRAADLADGDDDVVSCDVWIAMGTYLPTGQSPGLNDDQQTDRTRTIRLRDGVSLFGGFSANPDAPCERDVAAFETIFSGDFNQDDDTASGTTEENANHVVFMFSEADVSAPAERASMDGITITAGNANHSEWGAYRCGAGLFVVHRAFVSIANCTFHNNHSILNGGAIAFFNSSQSLGYVAIQSTFSENSAGYGGAINNSSAIHANAINCTFRDNYASVHGGAIMNDPDTNSSVVGSVFTGNEAADSGGAILNQSRTKLTIANSTFSNNSALEGGAIYNDIVSTEDDRNMAIENTIVWQNIQNVDSFQVAWRQIDPAIGHSIIENWDLIVAADTDTAGMDNDTDVYQWDPLFSDSDLHLADDSPCIDAGENGALPADDWDVDGNGDTEEPLPLDIDAQSRIHNGVVDIGADENQNN